MKFPRWSPTELKERHRKLTEHRRDAAFDGFAKPLRKPRSGGARPDAQPGSKRRTIADQRERARQVRLIPTLPIAACIALQERLITDDRMRPVWDALRNCGAEGQDLVRFCLHLEDILKDALGLPRLTRANRRDLLTDIGNLARKLIVTMRLLPELDRFPNAPDAASDPRVHAFGMFLHLMDADRVAANHLLPYIVADKVSPLQVQLLALASYADVLRKRPDVARNVESPQQHVARRLSELMTLLLKSPRDDLVATVTSVVLELGPDTEVSTDSIRKTRTRSRKDSFNKN